MNECIFCKIIRGEIPSYKVYEDDAFMAFLDIQPVNLGHVLVVPKTHSANLLDMADADAAKFLPVIKKIAAAALASTGAEAFNLGVNTGAAAGQVIFHTHIHVMPRFPDDGLKLWGKRVIPDDDMRRVAEQMRNALA